MLCVQTYWLEKVFKTARILVQEALMNGTGWSWCVMEALPTAIVAQLLKNSVSLSIPSTTKR